MTRIINPKSLEQTKLRHWPLQYFSTTLDLYDLYDLPPRRLPKYNRLNKIEPNIQSRFDSHFLEHENQRKPIFEDATQKMAQPNRNVEFKTNQKSQRSLNWSLAEHGRIPNINIWQFSILKWGIYDVGFLRPVNTSRKLPLPRENSRQSYIDDTDCCPDSESIGDTPWNFRYHFDRADSSLKITSLHQVGPLRLIAGNRFDSTCRNTHRNPTHQNSL